MANTIWIDGTETDGAISIWYAIRKNRGNQPNGAGALARSPGSRPHSLLADRKTARTRPDGIMTVGTKATGFTARRGELHAFGPTRQAAIADLLTKERAMPEETATFETSSEAWAFMRECQVRGWSPGYPSYQAPYTVRYYRMPERALLARPDMKRR